MLWGKNIDDVSYIARSLMSTQLRCHALTNAIEVINLSSSSQAPYAIGKYPVVAPILPSY